MEPMEGEIIDLNRPNMLHSQISCVHVARHTRTRSKHKWDSFFILKDRQDRHVFMCVSSSENVESLLQHECIGAQAARYLDLE